MQVKFKLSIERPRNMFGSKPILLFLACCVLATVLPFLTWSRRAIVNISVYDNAKTNLKIVMMDERKKHTSGEQRLITRNDTCLGLSCTKTIMFVKRLKNAFRNYLFSACEYSNCRFKFSDSYSDLVKSPLAFVEFKSPLIKQITRVNFLPNQLILVYAHEPPAYKHNQWKKIINNFNGTATYRDDSAISMSFGSSRLLSTEKWNKTYLDINYAKGKTKGAYAYVSNCKSINYKRLELMKQLSKYINVSVMGNCTKAGPCSSGDKRCEAKVHSQYRFYLAFENSLCKDYITEKFWKTLHSPSYFVPVVIGGLSIDDYSEVAPPNSFIHVYNFSSVEKLGKYLQHLMTDDAAYNRYHQWRQRYTLIPQAYNVPCDMCKLAHNPSSLSSIQHRQFADEWNAAECRNKIIKVFDN